MLKLKIVSILCLSFFFSTEIANVARAQEQPPRRRPIAPRPIASNATADRDVRDTIPTATEAQLQKWNGVVENTRGVAGNEFFGRQSIGTNTARSEGALAWYPEWSPIIEPRAGTGAKRTLCGKVLTYGRTNDVIHKYLLLDDDRTINIKPFPQFSKLLDVNIDLAQNYRDRIHVEIDLPDDVGLRMFSYNGGYIQHLADGQGTLCVYGPHVIDSGGVPVTKKVEIHPAEQIWIPGLVGGYLTSTLDYSQRFDESNARWVTTPLLSRYAIPFEVKPGAPKLWFYVQEFYEHNMSVASTDGLTHELAVREPKGERSIVYVEQLSPFGTDYTNIDFQDVVRRPDGTIQGYIVLSSRVGTPGMVGGHISHTFARGHAPLDYIVDIVSVKRITNNSFKLQTGQRVWTFPNPLPANYDEKFARVIVKTAKDTQQEDFSMNVGETKSAQSLRTSGVALIFEKGAHFRVEVRDKNGFGLGAEAPYVPLNELGQLKTVDIIKTYRLFRPKGGAGGGLSSGPRPRPGIDTNPPPVEDPGVEVPEGETVVKFRVSYRVNRATAPSPPPTRRP